MRGEVTTPLDVSAHMYAYKINYNLVNNARYFRSNDPLYHAALEIRLLYSISEALVGYFTLRHVYWKGEKNAILYLREHDPKYLGIFEMACRGESLKTKFNAYCKLAEESFTAEYPKWENDVAVSMDGYFGSFWNELLKVH